MAVSRAIIARQPGLAAALAVCSLVGVASMPAVGFAAPPVLESDPCDVRGATVVRDPQEPVLPIQVCRPSTTGRLVWGNQYLMAIHGDSLSGFVMPAVTAMLQSRQRGLVLPRAEAGSAPCDWWPQMDDDRTTWGIFGDPDAVILQVRGHNRSRCQLVGGRRAASGSATFWSRYRSQIARTCDRFSPGTPIWLVSPPGGSAHSEALRVGMLREMRRVAAARPNVSVVDLGPGRFSPSRYVAALTSGPVARFGLLD